MSLYRGPFWISATRPRFCSQCGAQLVEADPPQMTVKHSPITGRRKNKPLICPNSKPFGDHDMWAKTLGVLWGRFDYDYQ